MRSYVTSYNALFSRRAPDAPAVERIEIPLIQRDYAQGRDGDSVARIRTSFLNVLHEAVMGGAPISLDFVYGEVDRGTLRPLDGQQRLTTLFLLHWYLAFRAGRLDSEHGWKRFSYATRPTARMFCERIVTCNPTSDVERVSAWIEDQPWFLHTWKLDPTIQSMLVMLDAMHARFATDDCRAAWDRLLDEAAPAISFHLLPSENMGPSEELYIKMNSRGKPLTAFENFKARFEQVLESSCPVRVEEFAFKVDVQWADLLWPYRGSDSIVDDEFLRYFQFVTEVCEWQDGQLPAGSIEPLAERVYGTDNPKAANHLDFLVRCFDTWVGANIASAFSALFTLTPAPLHADTREVVVFGPPGGVAVDLFGACCETYGQARGRNRAFSWPQTIFLYAVLIHRIHDTRQFPQRLRMLRNLVEASNNELRLERMPSLIADVRRIVAEGSIDGASSFNQTQVADETLKADFLAKAPGLERVLFHLEDHAVLRGCLAAFELDGTVFERRARAFHDVFAEPELLPALTGALLATGDYSRQLDHRVSRLGSGSNLTPWRELMTGAGRSELVKTREILGRLLDAVAEQTGGVRAGLEAVTRSWLGSIHEANGLDWRWYFVKYAAMREGRSGIYVSGSGALGYDVCMLDKTQMNSWYRDPYLTAIHRESGVANAVEEPWFTGYETAPRWMRLESSGTSLRCVDNGFLLRPPAAPEHAAAFSRVCAVHDIAEDLWLKVPQVELNGRTLDAKDRVQCGAAMIRDLVDAGL